MEVYDILNMILEILGDLLLITVVQKDNMLKKYNISDKSISIPEQIESVNATL